MWTIPSAGEGYFPIASERNHLECNNNINSASQQPDAIPPHSPSNLMSFRPVNGSQMTRTYLKKLNGGFQNCPCTQSNVIVEKTPGVNLPLLEGWKGWHFSGQPRAALGLATPLPLDLFTWGYIKKKPLYFAHAIQIFHSLKAS